VIKLIIQAAVLGFIVGAMIMAGSKAADWAIPDKPRAPLKLKVTPDEAPAEETTANVAARRGEI
jgi:hypothetical protein